MNTPWTDVLNAIVMLESTHSNYKYFQVIPKFFILCRSPIPLCTYNGVCIEKGFLPFQTHNRFYHKQQGDEKQCSIPADS